MVIVCSFYVKEEVQFSVHFLKENRHGYLRYRVIIPNFSQTVIWVYNFLNWNTPEIVIKKILKD